MIVYWNVPAFKEWPTNFKLLFQALAIHMCLSHTRGTHNTLASDIQVYAMLH